MDLGEAVAFAFFGEAASALAGHEDFAAALGLLFAADTFDVGGAIPLGVAGPARSPLLSQIERGEVSTIEAIAACVNRVRAGRPTSAPSGPGWYRNRGLQTAPAISCAAGSSACLVMGGSVLDGSPRSVPRRSHLSKSLGGARGPRRCPPAVADQLITTVRGARIGAGRLTWASTLEAFDASVRASNTNQPIMRTKVRYNSRGNTSSPPTAVRRSTLGWPGWGRRCSLTGEQQGDAAAPSEIAPLLKGPARRMRYAMPICFILLEPAVSSITYHA